MRGRAGSRVPAPPPQVDRQDEAGDACPRSTTACGWSSTAPAPAAARGSSGSDVSGKTGTAQVISLTGAKAARGKMDVRDHGWFVFFAPRDNPEIAGVVFAEHAEHGCQRRADREVRDRDVLREARRAAAAVLTQPCRPSRWRGRRSRHRRRPRRAGVPVPAARSSGRRERLDVRTPAVLPRRLAPARRRAADRRHRPDDDLQHDLRGRAPARTADMPAAGSGSSSTPLASASSRCSSSWRSTTACWPSIRCCCSAGWSRCWSSCSSAAHGAGGSQRWIALGLFKLQPSEFARPTLALILAMYFGENRRGARNYGDLIIAGALFRRAVPAHRQAAGPRHGGDADSGRVSASRIWPGCGCG